MARKRKGLLADERSLSVAVFVLYYSWVMAIPYLGQILLALGELYGINVYTLMYGCLFSHMAGLFCCGFFCRTLRCAKIFLQIGCIISFAATAVLFFPPTWLWTVLMLAASLFSGMFVSAWAYFYKNGTPHTMRMKTAADALVTSNLLMVALNLITIHVSVHLALGLCMLSLLSSLYLSRRLPEQENSLRRDGQASPEEEKNEKGYVKSLTFIGLFILLSTVNGGLMFQVIKPAYEHLTYLSSWYWTVPYIAVLAIIRNLRQVAYGVYYLYIGVAMGGLAFLAFWVLPVTIWSYLIVDTLLMCGVGIFNLYWWSVFGTMLSFTKNPSRVAGLALSANVIGVMLGGVYGYFVNTGMFTQMSVIVVALVVIFIMVALLPLVHRRLLHMFGSYAFVSSESIDAPEQTTTQIPNFQTLSAREHEVAMLLLKGLPYRIISEQLHISENTVKTYVKNIYSKLEVQGRTELIKLGSKRGNL